MGRIIIFTTCIVFGRRKEDNIGIDEEDDKIGIVQQVYK
jgi:hypothetical protein